MTPLPPDLGRPVELPTWRGLLHAYAVWLALAATVVIVAVAPQRDARLAAGIYGGALCTMFTISGLYHRWRWNPRWRPVLRRLDHATIFLFIAATTTPLALLVLTEPLGTVVLVLAWVGAVVGMIANVALMDGPRGLAAATYVLAAGAAFAGVPQLVDRLPAAPLILLGWGTLLYGLGAVVYATKRPDPWPRTFGFHEVFHSLVLAAAACHFVAIAAWVILRA